MDGRRGGRRSGKWKKWLEARVTGCVRRAAAWAAKRQRPVDSLPSSSEWRSAILEALRFCEGRVHYSKFPLSLAGHNTDWNWPSVDHISSPAVAKVVIETRLVNDMKTITSEEEFRALIGHLAAVLCVAVKKIGPDWQCRRSFAIEELPDAEPPLPE